MVEIDPEVAALLDDLPPIALPDELETAGWGHFSMVQMIAYGQERPRPPSEGPQAPTFDGVCVQCGRPITDSRGRWTDHGGRTRCDGALVDKGDYFIDTHATQAEYDYRKNFVAAPLQSRKSKKFKDLKRKVDCSKTKHSNACAHQCAHPDGHFGFHECKTCRHLWG